jgi:acyl carrier protein
MERSEIETRVKQVIGRVLGREPGEIEPRHNFIFDLGADSQQSVELVAGFEEEFDTEMDQDEALQVQTVGDAVDYIERTVSA